MAFHIRNCVGTRDDRSFAVQWLACALPCRRFAGALADVCARLGADVDRYSFIVMDSHRLLFAGLPAHPDPAVRDTTIEPLRSTFCKNQTHKPQRPVGRPRPA